MRVFNVVATLLLAGLVESAGRGLGHAGKRHVQHAAKRAMAAQQQQGPENLHLPVVSSRKAGNRFLTNKTEREFFMFFSIHRPLSNVV